MGRRHVQVCAAETRLPGRGRVLRGVAGVWLWSGPTPSPQPNPQQIALPRIAMHAGCPRPHHSTYTHHQHPTLPQTCPPTPPRCTALTTECSSTTAPPFVTCVMHQWGMYLRPEKKESVACALTHCSRSDCGTSKRAQDSRRPPRPSTPLYSARHSRSGGRRRAMARVGGQGGRQAGSGQAGEHRAGAIALTWSGSLLRRRCAGPACPH